MMPRKLLLAWSLLLAIFSSTVVDGEEFAESRNSVVGDRNDLFESLRGRKLVSSWNGDVVDTVKSAAVGAGVGLAARSVLRLAFGLSFKIACTATVAAVWMYAGILFFPSIANAGVLNFRVPPVVLRTRETLFKQIDTDRDGTITPNDFKKIMADVELVANRNLHSSFGAIFAFGATFAFL